MNGYGFILARQTAWAKNRGLALIGSKVERGMPAYTTELDDNLFQPLLPAVRASFLAGDGGELIGYPAKMQAVHSSSALAVNVFQYWQAIGQAHVIVAACGLCKPGAAAHYRLHFEEKHPIAPGLGKPPNIDVVFHNHAPGAKVERLAVECKFSEAYGMHTGAGLKEKYLALPGLWDDIPHLRVLAERISPLDSIFAHLHPAQLIKHILALKGQCGTGGFRLLYLWYDVVGGQGDRHREEVAQFAAVAKADGILFYALTYQELIARLDAKHRVAHPAYIAYLTARYL